MVDWRTLGPAELAAQYNPRLAVPDFEQHFEAFTSRSAEARARLGGDYDIAYGDTPLQNYDLHRPARLGNAAAPLAVIVHGGYWRGLDKSLHSFLAEPLVAAGAVVANINYDLAPKVTLDVIVGQVQRALSHLAEKATGYGADPSRLHVIGHSAGAHLAAAAFTLPWAGTAGSKPRPAGLALVSGIYDLEPVLHIPVNGEIGLDGAMAARHSLMHKPLKLPCPVLVAVGDAETPSWIAQSVDYHAACRDAGTQAHLLRIAGANHFSILYPLADVRQPLGGALLRQMKLNG